ncbi:MAG: sigma-70 family RNA polymerase sigma factor [Polyangiales bacterium]
MPTEERTYLRPTDLTERELVARMLERDDLAWREFHRRYDRLVFRCIHKVTVRFRSVLGSEDVREIYSQFLVNLTARDMHRLRAFAPERGNKLGSWIGMLATNAAWDHLRALSRQPVCTELVDELPRESTYTDPHSALEQKQDWDLVNGLLRGFSEKDRDFVRLFYVDGLTPEQVAEEMEISVKTVYSKKHKIRCRLEGVLSERRLTA